MHWKALGSGTGVFGFKKKERETENMIKVKRAAVFANLHADGKLCVCVCESQQEPYTFALSLLMFQCLFMTQICIIIKMDFVGKSFGTHVQPKTRNMME